MIDAIVVRARYSGASQLGMRQIFFAGDRYWSRESTDVAGEDWPSAWADTTLAAAWGSQTNHPPINRVDSAVVHERYDGSGDRTSMRQIFVAGGGYWSRVSSDAAGESWPSSWTETTLSALWGSDSNHPPTDHIDAMVVRARYSGSSITQLRQVVFASNQYWQRDTSDLSGTSWPSNWRITSLSTA